MRVLVTGINGLLGKDIGNIFSQNKTYEVYGLGRAKCLNEKINYRRVDLTDFNELGNILDEIRPDIIIHCAAYTKLDDCEKNQDYARLMNIEVTEYLAGRADRFVYISSDAVFSGHKGNYKEDEVSDAVNYYGYTKYAGERAAEKNEKALIIRSSIYGFNTNGNQSIAEWGARNLVAHNAINGFEDVKFNPLYSVQLASILMELIEQDYKGIFHLGSRITISKYDFFRLLARELNVDEKLVIPVSVDAVTFVAKRTKDTSLNIEKISGIINKYNNLEDGIKQLVSDMKYYRRL